MSSPVGNLRLTSGSESKQSRLEKVLTKASSAAAAIKSSAERLTLSPPNRRLSPSSSSLSVAMDTNRAKASAKSRTPSVSREPSPRPTREIDSSPHNLVMDIEEHESATPTRTDSGRKSLLYLTPKRGTGIEMDLATKEANEILQRGKAALEAAANMKKECKIIACDSLQQLYEAFLCIADSRARHKCNLEKERSLHAHQLLQVEKDHTKELHNMRLQWIALLNQVSEGVRDTLNEAKAVRSWLGYETEAPFRGIEQLKSRLTAIEGTLTAESKKLHTGHTGEANARKWDLLEGSLAKVTTKIASVSNQIQSLQNRIEDLDLVFKTPNPLAIPDSPPAPQSHQQSCPASEAIPSLLEKINTLEQLTRKALDRPPVAITSPPMNIASHLEPIEEKLQALSSNLKELQREKHQPPLAPTPNLQQDLALAEVKESLANIEKKVERKVNNRASMGPLTFAQVTSRPPKKAPNHTLIIGSKDPTHTGEKVMERVREALDLKNTGAKVDKVRKAKNQKIVLNCASKEDLRLIKEKVSTRNGLTVQEPKAANPLVCIRNVLHAYTNKEIEDLLVAQNQYLLQDVDVSKQVIKVRYRKRARNPLQSHPVLELSTQLYMRFMQVEKVHLGIGRSVIEDQSPLVQCAQCLGYGHTRNLCNANKTICGYCSGEHTGRECPIKAEKKPPTCINCTRAKKKGADLAHAAFSEECQERQKWDRIARSRIAYC